MQKINDEALGLISGGQQFLKIITKNYFTGVPDSCITEFYVQQLQDLTASPDHFIEQLNKLCPSQGSPIKMKTHIISITVVDQ